MKRIEHPCFDRALSFQPAEELVAADMGDRLEVQRSDVHIWGVTLEASDRCLTQCSGWLSPDEHLRTARFLREEHRRRYILAHGALRSVLSRYCGVAPASLKFSRTPSGKPTLPAASVDRRRLSFNLSHSAGRALIAVASGQEIGVDLDQLHGDLDAAKLARRFFTKAEHLAIMKLPPEQQRPAFIRYWVAKEAVLKGQGVGLPSLEGCEIEFASSGDQAQVRTSADSSMQPGWWVCMIPCGSGWGGAVAALGNEWTVKYVGLREESS